jgi:hypothetical protein
MDLGTGPLDDQKPKAGDIVPDEEVSPVEASSDQGPKSGVVVPDEEVTPLEKTEKSGDIVPDEEVTSDSEKYQTPLQTAGAVAEAVGRGFAGPGFTLLEKGASKLGVPGLANEDIQGRKEQNPNLAEATEAATLAGTMALGTGEAELVARMATGALKLGELSKLGAMGQKAFTLGLQAAVLAGGDDVSKALIGKGNLLDAVVPAMVDMGAAFLIGAPLGAAGQAVATGAKSVVSGIAPKIEGAISALGKRFPAVDNYIGKVAEGYEQALAENVFQNSLQKYFGALKNQTVKIPGGVIGALALNKVPPVIRNALLCLIQAKNNPEFIGKTALTLEKYGQKIGSGTGKIAKAVDALWEPGAALVAAKKPEGVHEEIKKFIESGAINSQIQSTVNPPQEADSVPKFAHGGEVNQMPEPVDQVQPEAIDGIDQIAKVYPAHATVLAASKMRMANYLNALRPQPPIGQRPFDKREIPAKAKREYDRAIEIAASPLSILNHVKDGTLTSPDLRHFSSMYPEVHDHLVKKMTDRITDDQIKGKQPPPELRRTMSLFMGTPLSSSLTPMAMQAIQATFAIQRSAQQTPGANPGGAGSKNPPKPRNEATLTKAAGEHMTSTQAASRRTVSQG